MFNKQVRIPYSVLESTFSFLRSYGKQELESHALWVGKRNGDILEIKEAIFPKQDNTPISFDVSEEEVHRINVEVYEKKLRILSQIHTHPIDAYHSDIDEEGAYLFLPDSLSIVIPDFGHIEATNFDCWEVYYFDGTEWKILDKSEVKKLFKII